MSFGDDRYVLIVQSFSVVFKLFDSGLVVVLRNRILVRPVDPLTDQQINRE